MEVTRDQYQVIVEAAHQLSSFIYSLMDSTPGRRLPEQWHELHDLMSLTGVIAGTAERYRDRAELPAAPIDLTIASDGPGHSVLCVCMECTPFVTDPF